MESWNFPIKYKNSPFDKSNESIKSTEVYGALLLRRFFTSLANEMQWKAGLFQSNIRVLHLTNRLNRQKFMGPFYYGDIFLSLANEMQQSNRKLHFSVRNKNSLFDKSIKLL